MEHRLSEKCPPNGDPIESTGQRTVPPYFYRMSEPHGVKFQTTLQNPLIDPRLLTARTRSYHLFKTVVDPHLPRWIIKSGTRSMRHTKRLDRKYPPWIGREHPQLAIHRHREHSPAVEIQ